MENEYTKKLFELTDKAKKGSRAIKEYKKILTYIFDTTHDYNYTVDSLLKVNFQVSELFFEQRQFTDEEINGFVSAYLENDVLKKSGNTSIYSKIFAMVCGFIKNGSDTSSIALAVLKIVSYGNNGKSKMLVNAFNKYVTANKLTDKLTAIINSLEDESRRNVLKDFLKRISAQDNVNEKPVETAIDSKTEAEIKKNLEQLALNNKLLTEQIDSFKQLNAAAAALIEKAGSYNKQNEIKFLTLEREKNKISYSDLLTENTKLKEECRKNADEIELLNAKLKELYEMDATAQNNELKALKRNISDALKYDYDGFMSSEMVCNEDNFMANYGALHRIFQSLERLGIDFE